MPAGIPQDIPDPRDAVAPVLPPELTDPSIYLNRELTWLAFNERVLAEAEDERTPLLERIKFVAIVASNLDEFFMKRIGGLKQQVAAGVRGTTVDGRTPGRQIEECYVVVKEIQRRSRALMPELLQRLAENGIEILHHEKLPPQEKRDLRRRFIDNIFPLLTPLAFDPAHPFPFISNLSLNLLVTVRYPEDTEHSLARVKVPVGPDVPRFVRVGEGHRFVLLEEVMRDNLDLLFPGMEIVSCEFFRITRNANVERDEEHADDLLALIESELKERRFAPIVRLEIGKGMDAERRGMLAAELDIDEEADVFEIETYLAKRDFFEIAALEVPALRYAPHHPVDHPRLQTERNLFHVVREAGSILLQHPYESFATSVERFLEAAAEDPKVRAIKMTLYRVAEDSRIIDFLIQAAQKGKQVAVVVELKARFSEAANIRLAERMEEAGVHVTYGVVGLKTHCKIILVVRKDFGGIRRYVHIGTGNYHSGTARLYCDLGMLTTDGEIGRDATELFNYLTTGFTPKRHYRKLLPAPKHLKKALLEKIAREAAHQAEGRPGLIQFKMNALEDEDIVRALYEVARAGVRVDLLVRDSCRIRPGIPGLSESVRVVSIVGRFLEHARIYHFRNGGEEEYFIGSADAMKRSLEHRVEVIAPVEDRGIRREIQAILDAQLSDRRSAWEMRPDGSYRQWRPAPGEEERGTQQIFIDLAEKRHRDGIRLKKRKPKGPGGRNQRVEPA